MNFLPQFGVHSHYTYNIPVPERPDSTDALEYAEGSRTHRPVAQNTCFGLPYQDHNYGAPPPPTPPPSPPPNRVNGVNGHIDIEDVSCNTTVVTSGQQHATQEDSTGVPDSETVVDDSITRCICDYIHDDGYMICCDRCSVWQHVDCMGVDRNNIPEIYYCERCEPRKLNKQRAVQLQTRKREILMIDTSATESENETKQFISKPRGRKKKIEKRENNNKLINGKKKNRKFRVEKDSGKKPLVKKSPQQSCDNKKSPVKNKIKAVKSPIVSFEEDNVIPWESEQYADTYEEAPGNHYSAGVQELLSSKKVNGHQQATYVLQSKPPIQLRAQLCRVSQFGDNHRGLEAVENLSPVEPLIEYKGNVMLRDQYNKENRFFQSFQPHILFYSQVDLVDLCIDASSYGNDARHVRRSCCANAEIKHFLDGAQIYFYIYTTKSIAKGQEITIPFDFNYQECNYGVDCACGKANCVVVRYHRGITNNSEEIPLQVLTKAAKKQKKIPKALDEPLHIDVPKVDVHTPVMSPPQKRRRMSSQSGSNKPEKCTPLTPIKVHHPPPGLASPKSPGLASPTMSGSSDHEGDDEKHKKMSREERKIAAIMKAFEKMEKREERRKDALARLESEKSQESEPECKVKLHETKVKTKTVRSKSVTKPDKEDVPLSPLLVRGKDKKIKISKDAKKNEKKKCVKNEVKMDEEQEESTESTSSGKCLIKEEIVEHENKVTFEEKSIEEVNADDKKVDITSDMLTEIEASEHPIDLDTQEEKASVITSPVKEDVLKASVKEEQENMINEEHHTEQVVEEKATKEERPSRQTRKKKRVGMTPVRRRTRVSSSISTNTDSADESSNSATPTTSTPVTVYPDYVNSSILNADKTFKLPKTKKHLMNEWLNEKHTDHSSPSKGVKADLLEINTLISEEAEADFVKCVPSPHTNSFSHLRRSSVSSASNHTKAVNSIPGVQLDTSMGSAKKRWLRQAMFERSSSAPTEKPSACGNTSPVVNSSATSPATSPPVDFVTPLKKRRFARESLNSESLCTQTPSTPTHISEAVPEVLDMSPAHFENDGSNTDDRSLELGEKTESVLPDVSKNGICHSLVPQKPERNIFEKLSLSKLDEESSKEVPVSSVNYDKLSKCSTQLMDNVESNSFSILCDLDEQEENDLKASCSQGFDIQSNECEEQIPHSSVMQQTSLTGKFAEKESEVPVTSKQLDSLNSTEISYSSNLNSFTCDPEISQRDSCNLKTSVKSNQFLHDQQTDGGIDSSCILQNEKSVLNISQDSGLIISDQEKTCSSSCDDSAVQDSMSSSFDSLHSVKGKVDSSQGAFLVQAESSHIAAAPSEENECEALPQSNVEFTEKQVSYSDVTTKFSANADSSKDHTSSIASRRSTKVSDLDYSLEIGSSRSSSSNNRLTSISEPNEPMSSLVDTSINEQMNKQMVEENVSCSFESTAEAEAKVCPNNEIAQTAEVSDLEEGELPPHSTSFKTSKVENEKEEGEITDDDEDIVDSSNVVHDNLTSNDNDHCLLEDIDSNEVERADSPTVKSQIESTVPIAYRLDQSSQNEVVSSSRSTSPYWDHSIYRKRGWWRQEKEATAAASTERSPRSHNSSPTTTPSYSPQSRIKDTRNDDGEQCVDSTSERNRSSGRRSLAHSPIVSSSEWNGGQRDRSISWDSTSGLSPASAVDSITSPTSNMTNLPAGKKKVSLLEYRKRMKQRSQDSGNSSSISISKSTSRSTPSTPVFPTLPLFPNLSAQKTRDKQSTLVTEGSTTCSPKDGGKKVKEDEVKWSATATMAERIREQTQLTLTERLRREFGLDTMDESEDNRDDESEDEPPPPPPPAPPATSSTVTHGPPQVRVITGTYHHPHQMQLPLQANQQLIPSGQILPGQILPNISKATVIFSNPTQQGTPQMIAATSVPTQIVTQAQLGVTNPTDSVTSSNLENLGHNHLVANQPTQLYPTQNMFSTMQQSSGVVSYTAQSNHFNINQLTSVPPPPLPLEPSQQPTVPQQLTQLVRHPTAPSLPLGPQPPAPEILQSSTTQPPTGLLPTQVVKAPLLPIPTPPAPQLLPPQIPIAAPAPATQQLILQQPISALPNCSATNGGAALLPTPQVSAHAAAVVAVSSVLQTSVGDGSANGGVPSLLSIPIMPTKGFNRTFMEDDSASGAAQGSNNSGQNYNVAQSPSVESSTTLVAASSSTQQIFSPQHPVLVNYNHGYPAASTFQH